MYTNDPIADLLTRIRNGLAAEHSFVTVRWSKLKESIVNLLKEEGFIKDFRVEGDGTIKEIRVSLKYSRNRESIIKGLKRLSSPGRRRYVKSTEIPYVLGGLGVSLVSTSKGVLVDRQARKEKVGGELLCSIW